MRLMIGSCIQPLPEWPSPYDGLPDDPIECTEPGCDGLLRETTGRYSYQCDTCQHDIWPDDDVEHSL